MGYMRYEAMFDSVLLTSIDGLSILSIDSYKLPDRALSEFALARADARKVNSAFYRERHIVIGCILTQPTRELLDTQVDNLKTILQGIEKQLIIPNATGRRAFTATLYGMPISNNAGGLLEFRLDFLCSDNFGYDLAFTQLLAATGRTLYNYTDNLGIIRGSAPWQAPVIKITISAVTGGTAADLTVKNPATGASMTITHDFTAGMLVEIDCQNETVKIDGVSKEFSGGFPLLQSNKVGYLQYTDNFLTRTMSEFVYHFRRWA